MISIMSGPGVTCMIRTAAMNAKIVSNPGIVQFLVPPSLVGSAASLEISEIEPL
jgi:hypothetical protein